MLDKVDRKTVNDLEGYIIDKFESTKSTENLAKTGRLVFTEEEKKKFKSLINKAEHCDLNIQILNGLFNLVTENYEVFDNTINKLFQDKVVSQPSKKFISALNSFECHVDSYFQRLQTKIKISHLSFDQVLPHLSSQGESSDFVYSSKHSLTALKLDIKYICI